MVTRKKLQFLICLYIVKKLWMLYYSQDQTPAPATLQQACSYGCISNKCWQEAGRGIKSANDSLGEAAFRYMCVPGGQ